VRAFSTDAVAATDVPHWAQKRAPAARPVPHPEQRSAARATPQWRQNLPPVDLPHDGQLMALKSDSSGEMALDGDPRRKVGVPFQRRKRPLSNTNGTDLVAFFTPGSHPVVTSACPIGLKKVSPKIVLRVRL